MFDTKEYYKKNKKRILEQQTEHRRVHGRSLKEIEERKWFKIKTRYGITRVEYNAMFEKQGGYCLGCGKHQSELDKALSVDHNHSTMKNRGLLCNPCNLAVGNAFDNPTTLRNLATYLEQWKSEE